MALRTPTPTSTPDLEREAILSFTLQALEIEAKRNELVAYFASLRDSVGIHGQALAIERFFSKGVPATLRDAPPSGFEGMATLRNRLLLLDSPQSIQPVKEAFLHAYDAEIQQALNQNALLDMSRLALAGEYDVDFPDPGCPSCYPETPSVRIQANQVNWGAPIRNLVYPEISSDNLDQWRQLVEQTEVGPVKDLYKYKVGTAWFGIQELRQQTYTRWAEILQEHGIDHAEAGLTVQNAPEGGDRRTPGSISEEAYGPYVSYLNVIGLGEPSRYYSSLGQRVHDVFIMQQRVGIFTEAGVGAEPSWEAYVQLHGGTISEVYEEAGRVLTGVLKMTPEHREQAGLTLETRALGDIEAFKELIRLAVRPTSGAVGAKLLVDQISYFERQWLLQQVSGQSGTFLDYLKDTFILSHFVEEN